MARPAYLQLPGLAIFLITLGFTLSGDGLRDAAAGEKHEVMARYSFPLVTTDQFSGGASGHRGGKFRNLLHAPAQPTSALDVSGQTGVRDLTLLNKSCIAKSGLKIYRA